MTADELLSHARRVCRELMPTDHPAGVRSIDLVPGDLTLADLDAVLGERRDSPRMPFADRVWWYQLRENAAPYVCSVFAASPDGHRLSRITLRQDPPAAAAQR
jgi:hypothetical protein